MTFIRNFQFFLIIQFTIASIFIPVSILFLSLGFSHIEPLYIKLFFTTFIVSLSSLSLIVSNFFNDTPSTCRKPRHHIFQQLVPLVSVIIILLNFISFEQIGINTSLSNVIIILPKTFTSLFMFPVVLLISNLFILENLYRFALSYQRKIARIAFIGFTFINLYFLFFSSKIMLYQTISLHDTQMYLCISGLTYPLILFGFLRYRISSEHITIPRNAVYSTFSLILTGAVFLGAGTLLFFFRFLDWDLAFFPKFFFIYSSVLFSILLAGSGEMRKRIIDFVNTNFYTYKYDYKSQFFKLHSMFLASDSLSKTITELIENMKYAFTADDAYIFIHDEQTGNFNLQQNKEVSAPSGFIISGESSLIIDFNTFKWPLTYQDSQLKSDQDNIFEILKVNVIFPIRAHSQLLGFLALKLRSGQNLDKEDIALIDAFAHSIGDAIFKNKILTERIERKQFESFTQVSSFIIHDIKNQVATLSLISKNSEKNISNPEFQKSLLRSIHSCSENLTSLIDKLSAPPRKESLNLIQTDVTLVIKEVINSYAPFLSTPVEFTPARDVFITSDRQALHYVLKNLLKNSLEATDKDGLIIFKTGWINELNPEQIPDPVIFKKFQFFILISDNGCGMDQFYVQDRLFRPFSTTKDKGFGIGLYQCKILIEGMGGKILCYSKKGEGTDFFLLFR